MDFLLGGWLIRLHWFLTFLIISRVKQFNSFLKIVLLCFTVKAIFILAKRQFNFLSCLDSKLIYKALKAFRTVVVVVKVILINSKMIRPPSLLPYSGGFEIPTPIFRLRICLVCSDFDPLLPCMLIFSSSTAVFKLV